MSMLFKALLISILLFLTFLSNPEPIFVKILLFWALGL